MNLQREYEITNQILDALEENGMRLTEWLVEYARIVAKQMVELEEMFLSIAEEESEEPDAENT